MRRWIAAQLCAMLCGLLCFAPVAGAAESERILFRGFEWWTSFEDAAAQLEGDWTFAERADADPAAWGAPAAPALSVSSIMAGKMMGNERTAPNTMATLTASPKDGEPFLVGGYPAAQFEMYFLCSKIDSDDPRLRSGLYAGAYTLRGQDVAGMYADLKQKLSALYGFPMDETWAGQDTSLPYFLWTDEDVNRVRLEPLSGESGDTGVRLVYSCYDASDAIGRINTYLMTEAACGNGDTSGL